MQLGAQLRVRGANQAAPSAWAICVWVTVSFARLMIKAPVAGRLLNSRPEAVADADWYCKAKALDVVGQDSGTMF